MTVVSLLTTLHRLRTKLTITSILTHSLTAGQLYKCLPRNVRFPLDSLISADIGAKETLIKDFSQRPVIFWRRITEPCVRKCIVGVNCFSSNPVSTDFFWLICPFRPLFVQPIWIILGWSDAAGRIHVE